MNDIYLRGALVRQHPEVWAEPKIDRAWANWSLFAASTVILLGSIALYVHYDFRSTLMTAHQRLTSELATSSMSVHRLLREADAALADNAHQLLLLEATGRDIKSTEVASAFRDRLIQQVADLPALISMSLMDENGEWMLSSRFSRRPPIIDNPRRPMWSAAKSAVQSKPFVLGPGDSPAIGMPSIVIGRSIRAPDNSLRGAALAFASTEALGRSFDAMIDRGIEVVVVGADGRELMGFPVFESDGARQTRLAKIASIGKADIYETEGARGEESLVATSRSAASSITVIAIQNRNDVLRDWRRHAVILAVVSFVAWGGVGVLFALWLRQRQVSCSEARAVSAAREELLKSLSCDSATGLLSRIGLRQRLSERAGAEWAAVLVIGVDRFRTITDTLGHDAGENLIAQVAERLKRIVPGSLQARLGSEDFCILTIDGDPMRSATAINESLSRPYQFGGREISLSVSVGVVDIEHGQLWSDILRDASAAMHRSRDVGPGGICRFDQGTVRPLQERLLIEQDLRKAIGSDQLFMVYQPILDFRTGSIVGFEALMRWNCPGRGSVPPGVFIPIAERSGLLLPVDRMVKRSPLEAAKDWPGPFFVSINYAAFEFRDRTLPARIMEKLETFGIPAERLCIEVTESALLDDDDFVIATMNEIKKIGVRLAIDDFGSGHASLSYLFRFPFDRIKIDRAFIAAMESDPSAAAIVDATLALGRKLNLEVVAEGVETVEQLEYLRKLGCTYAQGYLISRPLDEDAVGPFLRDFEIGRLRKIADPASTQFVAHQGSVSAPRSN